MTDVGSYTAIIFGIVYWLMYILCTYHYESSLYHSLHI